MHIVHYFMLSDYISIILYTEETLQTSVVLV